MNIVSLYIDCVQVGLSNYSCKTYMVNKPTPTKHLSVNIHTIAGQLSPTHQLSATTICY